MRVSGSLQVFGALQSLAVMSLSNFGRGNVGGTDRVTASDGGQALDVGADEPADHGGLGLTELRELRGDVRDRAVVLAQLDASGQTRGRRSVALAGQRSGQGLGTGEPVGPGGGDGLRAALLQPGQLVLGEGGHRLSTTAASQVTQSGNGEVVVGMWETVPAGAGEGELPRRPTAAAAGPVRSGMAGDPPLSFEGVQVPAYGGRRDAEFGSQVGRTQGTLPPEQVDHPITGTAVVGAAATQLGTKGGDLFW